MLIFIKRSSDLSNAWYGNAISWSNLPLESIGNESGQIAIPDDGNDYSGDFVVLIGGDVFLIDRTSPNNGVRTLTVVPAYNFFSRDLIWDGMNENETYASFLARKINREYRQCEDPAFKISYLQISVGSNNEIMPYREYDPPGIYNLVDIFEEALLSGVVLYMKVLMSIDGVWHFRVGTSIPKMTPNIILFNDGHATIISETYSKDLVSKITVFHPYTVESPDPDNPDQTISETRYESSIWYLSSDGTVSETIPEERATGNWIIIEINEDEDPEEMAKQEFSNNINSHKIEFYSDKDFSVWDPVILRINNDVFTSYITSKCISSNQEWFMYKCGELSTTLTERVGKLENKK